MIFLGLYYYYEYPRKFQYENMTTALSLNNYTDAFQDDTYQTMPYEVKSRNENENSELSSASSSTQLTDFVIQLEEDCDIDRDYYDDEEFTCFLSLNLIFFSVFYLVFIYYSIMFWKIK